MSTIVTYTDAEPTYGQFPQRIISLTPSRPCCLSSIEDLGRVRREERYEYAYRRCRTCGFTVRLIVRHLPDQVRIADVRKLFTTLIGRGLAGA
jgi:hypothetical protein